MRENPEPSYLPDSSCPPAGLDPGAVDRRMLLAGLGVVGAMAASRLAGAGSLTPPPGAIGSTPGPEPRTPLSAATTPGDGACVFRIIKPGSYYLTADLLVPSGMTGIRLGAIQPPDVFTMLEGVTLDLNGFAIRGDGISGTGIDADGSVRVYGLSVRNGSIINTPTNGLVAFGWFGLTENLYVNGITNGTCIGMLAGTVRNCYANGQRGIVNAATTPITIIASIALASVYGFSGSGLVEHSNLSGTTGACSASNSVFRGCVLNGPADFSVGSMLDGCQIITYGTGVVAADALVMRGCRVGGDFNAVPISVGTNALIESCQITGGTTAALQTGANARVHGCNITSPSGHGILAGVRAQIENNRVGPCGKDGIRTGSFASIRRNSVFDCLASGTSAIRIDGSVGTAQDNDIVNCSGGVSVTSNKVLIARNTMAQVANPIGVAVGGNWYPIIDIGGTNSATNPLSNVSWT